MSVCCIQYNSAPPKAGISLMLKNVATCSVIYINYYLSLHSEGTLMIVLAGLALEKFQYLLYNKRFILEIDSKNLTFLNNTTSSRVYRWKLAIQRYDFTIKHIAGATNVVADAFSWCVLDEHSTAEYPVQAVASMN